MKILSSAMMWLVALALATGAASPALAVTFNVNSPFDVIATAPLDNGICETSPGNGVCTLRAAIMKANHVPGGGATIVVPAGIYTLTMGPMTPFDETTGSLKILQTTAVVGAGMGSTIVDAAGIDRVFYILGGTIGISNMTIQNGNANTGMGGGIFSSGDLTLSNVHLTNNQAMVGGGVASSGASNVMNDCVVDQNKALDSGGGVSNTGMLTMNRTSIGDNIASNGGGIINLRAAGSDPLPVLTLNDMTVSGNQSQNSGGGVYNQNATGSASLTVNRSTINANSAHTGGGIATDSGTTMAINNSTLSANTAISYGGAIANSGVSSLFHTTIAGNLSDNGNSGGGSIGGGLANTGGSLSVWNSLLADNFSATIPDDCVSTTTLITSEDYNYATSCVVDGITTHNINGGADVNLLLGPLQDNGGPTQTRALGVGSVVVDQIPPNLCRDSFGVAPTTDQRGVQRPVNSLCDMGAFEGSVPLPLFGVNLILNGDAEDGGASPSGAFVGAPHWVSTGRFTVVPYGAPGGFPAADGSDLIPATHGYNFFAGGNSPGSQGIQTVDLTAGSAAFDAGTVTYVVSGDFGGFASEDDNASMTLQFQDSQQLAIGGLITVGGFTSADRGGKTGLLHSSASGKVPTGTRYFQVIVKMVRTAGTYNDGYADNLSLVLSVPTPPALQSAASRRTHGAAGTFDLPLSLADIHNPTTEPRQGPNQMLVFTFDKAITGATASITEGVATAETPTFSGNEVIVGLTGVTNKQYVTVALTGVASTDGGSGGSASVRIGFLAGDVNQNRAVTVSDVVLVNNQIAHSVTAANYLKDLNASGAITVGDKVIANANVTKSLPAP
jgi:hypothetical protein